MKSVSNSFILESATDSCIHSKGNMRAYLSEELNIRLSEVSFDTLFNGYYLPMERFKFWPDSDIPSGVEKDIRLWLFIRFLGRKPKLNILGEFDAEEAKPFAKAFINATKDENWKEKLYDPLDNGYLPY